MEDEKDIPFFADFFCNCSHFWWRMELSLSRYNFQWRPFKKTHIMMMTDA